MLTQFLNKETNRKISPKMKLQFEGNEKGYFRLREEIEEKVILETNWLPFWKDCEFLDEPLENLTLFTDSDLLTLNQVLVESLKDFIDVHLENDSICIRLRELREATFMNLRTRFPELGDEDGFQEYLGDRERRENKEDYRKTGSQCIHCGSENVTSYGKEWLCKSCGKRFRKR
jgi:hypothetical protein